jgi:4-carboxymuconolactone decarboxylase
MPLREGISVARLQGGAGTGPVADLIRRRRGGALRPLDEILLLSPPVAEGWSVLLSTIRGELALDPALRELVILRIAVLNQADYEWVAHEPVARRVGVTDDQIGALRQQGGDVVFSPLERAVLAYADAMTTDVKVGQDVFDAVADLLDQKRMVELTAVIATYNMVSRFLVAMDLSGAEYGPPPAH